MGDILEPGPVLLILAAFSRHEAALAWGLKRAEAQWGRVVLTSPRFSFVETAYYEPSMGRDIQKCFWAFEELVDPEVLAGIKVETNAWEAEYAAWDGHADPRPLNLDPGYITSAKLVLASTKDHAHRIYLSRGIYAEVTLYYKDNAWQHRDFTFPDYRRADYQSFFSECRAHLRRKERERPTR